MMRLTLIISYVVLLAACAYLPFGEYGETIGPIKVVNVEDIENLDDQMERVVKGVISAPIESDEEWFLAFQGIYLKKKVAGMDLIIKLYLPDEDVDNGIPHAVGKFMEDKRTSIKVDGRPIKVAKP